MPARLVFSYGQCLKAEKRMIQSTDRKILDVNRQTQIDNEINKLENTFK